MNKQEIEKIKAAVAASDYKAQRKNKGFRILKYISFGGLGCLSWTATMLLTISIVADPSSGVQLYLIVNKYVYYLYGVISFLLVVMFFLEGIIHKNLKNIPEVIVENPTDNKNKKKN